MIQNLIKGHDNELIFRVKQKEDGGIVNLNSDLGYPLTGVRIYLYNKFRKVVLKYAADITQDPNTGVITFSPKDTYLQIYPVKKDKGIISIKVTRSDMSDMSDGPYYMRSRLIFDRSGYPSNNYYHSMPDDLLYCGQVIGDNDFDIRPEEEVPADPNPTD